MSDARELLENVLVEHASLCGSCDAGLTMSCSCGDPRAAVVTLGNALRAVLDLIDSCETATQVSEGTILAVAVKIRMGAYERVREAITAALEQP